VWNSPFSPQGSTWRGRAVQRTCKVTRINARQIRGKTPRSNQMINHTAGISVLRFPSARKASLPAPSCQSQVALDALECTAARLGRSSEPRRLIASKLGCQNPPKTPVKPDSKAPVAGPNAQFLDFFRERRPEYALSRQKNPQIDAYSVFWVRCSNYAKFMTTKTLIPPYLSAKLDKGSSLQRRLFSSRLPLCFFSCTAKT
jgi:hypothetical protein